MLTALGPKIWNKYHTNIKSLTSATKLKEYIRTWFGPRSKCNVCTMFIYFFSFLTSFTIFYRVLLGFDPFFTVLKF